MSNATLSATIEAINWLSDDIAQLWLAPQKPFSWHAGDYLEMAPEPDGNTRPFSIANAPNAAGRIELHIRHSGDEWYNALFMHKVGDTVYLAPASKQQYPMPAGDRPLLFVAGGNGFAPFKALIEQLLQDGFAQPITLYWGARRQQDLYQDEVIRAWARNTPTLTYVPVLSEEDWAGRTGLVADAVLEDHPDLSGFEIYVCGPWPMVQDARARFAEHGAERIH
ncbi:NAD(P)H-flavin reductase [Sulfurivirga caldicuralii]|uniref:NAD(P)H-flavin reductase n=1 Tax=Sulfurivirga caldicuralii TaxID=364032 RepID=A0A1N6DC66_9GAMM|nr:NAD(P)H-flavin reductase [Sulfurivirga caldicuralii]SIN68337.1 NAD(P)H-flavin reductase [Sulfurivirga caldicuralii]